MFKMIHTNILKSIIEHRKIGSFLPYIGEFLTSFKMNVNKVSMVMFYAQQDWSQIESSIYSLLFFMMAQIKELNVTGHTEECQNVTKSAIPFQICCSMSSYCIFSSFSQ